MGVFVKRISEIYNSPLSAKALYARQCPQSPWPAGARLQEGLSLRMSGVLIGTPIGQEKKATKSL
jgi:hypothetical protein